MSKDMINIDDLVRDKLNRHSEKEDPAAWLKMKDLLDKEMPERAAPFLFRFSKPVALLGAALLVGALCVGGYQLGALRDINNSKENTSTSITINNKHTAPEQNLTNNNNTPTSKETFAAQKPETNNPTNSEHIAATNNNSNNPTNTPNNPTNQTANSNPKNNTIASNSPKTAENKSKAAITANNNNNNKALNTNINTNKPNQQLAANNKTDNNTNASQAAALQKQIAETTNNTHDISKLNHAAAKNTTTNTTTAAAKALATDAKATKKTEPNTPSQNPLASKPNSNASDGKLVTDSMPAITVVSKTTISKTFPKKTINKLDTTSMGKVPVATTEPETKTKPETNKNTAKAASNNSQNKAANSAQNQYAAKAPATNSAPTAAETNTSKKKKATNNWFSNINFPEAVADAKKDLRNATFHFGFAGGVNYSPSKSNSFQGVQFGPTGQLVFNKHWSLFGAIKYFNRSGGKKTVNDNYANQFTTGLDSTVGVNNYFTIRTDSTNRYFNFSTLHSFELPLTVRYAINKIYLMTGINMAYSLALNVEQVEKEYKNVNPTTVITNATKSPILSSSSPKLSSADFGSRFATGWVLGAGYQISPAWQTDIRIVTPFWDNAQTKGAKVISKDFYRIPSVQISVGYQFGRSKRPTFGPTP